MIHLPGILALTCAFVVISYVVIDATKEAIRTGEASFAMYALTGLTFLLALAQVTILTLQRIL